MYSLQSYALTQKAHCKVSKETSGQHRLRQFVGHRNLRDALTNTLTGAPRAHQIYFNTFGSSMRDEGEQPRFQWIENIGEEAEAESDIEDIGADLETRKIELIDDKSKYNASFILCSDPSLTNERRMNASWCCLFEAAARLTVR